jgi:hypothetical protein
MAVFFSFQFDGDSWWTAEAARVKLGVPIDLYTDAKNSVQNDQLRWWETLSLMLTVCTYVIYFSHKWLNSNRPQY